VSTEQQRLALLQIKMSIQGEAPVPARFESSLVIIGSLLRGFSVRAERRGGEAHAAVGSGARA
jgi:hypothetical protein